MHGDFPISKQLIPMQFYPGLNQTTLSCSSFPCEYLSIINID